MKVMLICLFLLFSIIVLHANPYPERVFSELWFDDNGHFMVEFEDYSQWLTNYDSLYVSDGINEQPFTFDFSSVPPDSMIVLDFGEMYPGLSFNQSVGILILKNYYVSGSYTLEQDNWGNSLSNDIYPPGPGQSMVHGYNNMSEPEGYPYSWFIGEPPTPGETNQIAGSNLAILTTDQNINPVANVPLYYTSNNYYPIPPFGYTDENGYFTDDMLAGRWRVVARHPQTDEIVYNQTFWLYANQTTNISIQLTLTSNDDEVLPVPQCKGLKAYPVPFNLSKATVITFSYDGETRLSKDSYIRLYDIKGRFIQEIPFSAKGTTNWTPPRDIGSGMYFARLISGNRFVDKTIFSMIK